MAKVVMSGIGIVQLSGKFGQQIFARNKAGLYSREQVIVNDPATLSQLTIRERFTLVTQYWVQLTEQQRQAWEAAATANYWIWDVRLGTRFQPTGQQLFVKVNVSTIPWNFPVVLPPRLRSFAQSDYPLITDFFADADTGIQLDLNAASIPEDTVFQVLMTGSLSVGINRPRRNYFRIIAQIEAADFQQENDLTAEYEAIWPPLTPAKKIFVETQFLDITTGRRIIIEKISTIVTGA